MPKNWLRIIFWLTTFLSFGCVNITNVGYDNEKDYVHEPDWDNDDEGGDDNDTHSDTDESPDEDTDDGDNADGTGGTISNLELPFPDNEAWQLTRGYNDGSHMDYGYDWVDDRYALDFALSGCESWRKPIHPVREGTVEVVAYDDDGYGHYVLVNHGQGYKSRYAHFDEVLVSTGQSVTQDDTLGLCGNSGYTLGSACPDHPGTHLHFALYLNGEAAVPEPMSGHEDFTTGCWYGHHAYLDCNDDGQSDNPTDDTGDSGDDTATDDTGEGGDDPSDDCDYTVPSDVSTIQQAINLANAGEVVCVDDGDYHEDFVFGGVDITVRSVNGPDHTNLYGVGTGTYDPLVLAAGGETAAAVLEGFTLYGSGGRVVEMNGGVLTLRQIYIEAGASSTGVVIYGGAGATLENVRIESPVQYGVTVFGAATSVDVRNLIVNNAGSAGIRVGGSSDFTVANSVFWYCGYGGVWVTDADGHVENTIAVGHTYSGIHLDNSAYTLTADYNTGYDNTQGSTSGYVTLGYANTTQNPMFTNGSGGDFTLQTWSPCRNSGNPDSSLNDPDGTRNDKGAYGGPLGASW